MLQAYAIVDGGARENAQREESSRPVREGEGCACARCGVWCSARVCAAVRGAGVLAPSAARGKRDPHSSSVSRHTFSWPRPKINSAMAYSNVQHGKF